MHQADSRVDYNKLLYNALLLLRNFGFSRLPWAAKYSTRGNESHRFPARLNEMNQARAMLPEDEPLRLKDAVRIAFPNGGIKQSGLRREIKRGRLTCMMIAGKQFVTLRAINEMRERCRVEPKDRVSISAGGEAAMPCGSFSMEKTNSALAAAQVIAEGLKRPSAATSQRNTSPTGEVVTLQR